MPRRSRPSPPPPVGDTPPAFLLVTLALALAACASPVETSFDTDTEFDLSGHTTFAWIRAEPLIAPGSGEKRSSTFLSPIDDQRIRRAVGQVLTTKGYEPADDPEAADFILSYTIGTEEKLRVQNGSGYYGAWGPGYGRYGYGWGTGPNVQQYTEGTLAIEFWDRQTRQAVWVGWASQRLWRKPDRENYDVTQAVIALLEPFPTR